MFQREVCSSPRTCHFRSDLSFYAVFDPTLVYLWWWLLFFIDVCWICKGGESYCDYLTPLVVVSSSPCFVYVEMWPVITFRTTCLPRFPYLYFTCLMIFEWLHYLCHEFIWEGYWYNGLSQCEGKHEESTINRDWNMKRENLDVSVNSLAMSDLLHLTSQTSYKIYAKTKHHIHVNPQQQSSMKLTTV